MFAYIIRRVLYAVPILIGINVLTFYLFFVVNSPDDMARMHLGMKHVTDGGDREMEGQPRLRQAAVAERRGRGHRPGHRHHLLREVGTPVCLRFRLFG